jgi:hypothetical protein
MEHVVTERCYCKDKPQALSRLACRGVFSLSFSLSTSSFYQTLGISYTTEHFLTPTHAKF